MSQNVDAEAVEFLRKLGCIRQFSSGGHRAPHKPFLLLYALARMKDGVEVICYREADEVLVPLHSDYDWLAISRLEFWQSGTIE